MKKHPKNNCSTCIDPILPNMTKSEFNNTKISVILKTDLFQLVMGMAKDEWDAKLQKEVDDYEKELEDTYYPGITKDLIRAFLLLNDEGQQKAVERVEELTEIPKYQKETPPDGDPEA